MLLGNGDGTFEPIWTTGVSYIAGSYPYSIAVGDFNGDGWPDLAVANIDSNDVSILLNDGVWTGGGGRRAAGRRTGVHRNPGRHQLSKFTHPFRRNSWCRVKPPRPCPWHVLFTQCLHLRCRFPKLWSSRPASGPCRFWDRRGSRTCPILLASNPCRALQRALGTVHATSRTIWAPGHMHRMHRMDRSSL